MVWPWKTHVELWRASEPVFFLLYKDTKTKNVIGFLRSQSAECWGWTSPHSIRCSWLCRVSALPCWIIVYSEWSHMAWPFLSISIIVKSLKNMWSLLRDFEFLEKRQSAKSSAILFKYSGKFLLYCSHPHRLDSWLLWLQLWRRYPGREHQYFAGQPWESWLVLCIRWWVPHLLTGGQHAQGSLCGHIRGLLPLWPSPKIDIEKNYSDWFWFS